MTDFASERLPQGQRAHVLLSRLKAVMPAGDGRWFARCPAHDDRSPSLSVRDTGEKVLLNCFAGCDSSDVLAAVGLDWRDLYPDPWDCARLRPNEGACRYAKRRLAAADPLDTEREILRHAAAAIRDGGVFSLEDQARLAVAYARLEAAGG